MLSRKEDLFRKQFFTTLKILLTGLLIGTLGYYIGGREVNELVIIGLALATLSPILSLYIVMRNRESNIE